MHSGEPNKYTQEELLLMKSQDIGYILQKILSEKKVTYPVTGLFSCGLKADITLR